MSEFPSHTHTVTQSSDAGLQSGCCGVLWGWTLPSCKCGKKKKIINKIKVKSAPRRSSIVLEVLQCFFFVAVFGFFFLFDLLHLFQCMFYILCIFLLGTVNAT